MLMRETTIRTSLTVVKEFRAVSEPTYFVRMTIKSDQTLFYRLKQAQSVA